MYKAIVGVAVAVLVVGCVPVDVVKGTLTKTVDTALIVSEDNVCNNVTVGSIKRRYGKSKGSMQRWVDFCYPEEGARGVWYESKD